MLNAEFIFRPMKIKKGFVISPPGDEEKTSHLQLDLHVERK